LKAFLTYIAPPEDRLNDLPLTFVLAWRDLWISKISWNRRIMCCSFKFYDDVRH